MKSLGHMDDIGNPAAANITIEIGHIIAAQDVRPALRFHKDAAELRLSPEGRNDLRITRLRRAQQYTAGHCIESELVQDTRRRHHRPEEIVIKLAAVINACRLRLKGHDKIRLFNLLRFLKKLHDFIPLQTLLDNRKILNNNLAHSLLDLTHHVLRHARVRLYRAVKPFVRRKLHDDLRCRVKFPHSHDEQENDRALIDALPELALRINTLDHMKIPDRRLQIAQHIVHARRYDERIPLLLHLLHKLQQHCFGGNLPPFPFLPAHTSASHSIHGYTDSKKIKRNG